MHEETQAGVLASVVITTYNRCEALRATLGALGDQTVDPAEYELLVVDNGSSDDTWKALSELELSCRLRVFREPENVGISAARNIAIRASTGQYLILVSDDLLVPRNFIESHISSLRRHVGYWVVGGFSQLPSLNETAFGRYLNDLETSFDLRRRGKRIGPSAWEMTCPTARNLSMPRSDLDLIGLFDERFRDSCEDQDLAHRACQTGLRFLYDESITCVHNDQCGDLNRYCRAQERGAHDTVFFCAKYPALHGNAAIVRVNGYVSPEDGVPGAARKVVKSLLASSTVRPALHLLITCAERLGVSEKILRGMYRRLVGVYIFSGWRRGLRSLELSKEPDGQNLSCHSRV